MTNVITVSAVYTCNATGVVDLSPKGWEDVEDWYIKWDALHVKFKDSESWQRFNINSEVENSIDWKRPDGADIFAGAEEFEEELESTW